MNRAEEELRSAYGEKVDLVSACFIRDKDGHGTMRGMTGSDGNFVHLEEDLDNDISLICSDQTLSSGEYYRFQWRSVARTDTQLEVISSTLSHIEPSELLSGIFSSYGRSSGEAKVALIKSQHTVVNEVTGAEDTFIYELLQNANDYPHGNEKVKVQFIQTDDGLIVRHNGAEFTSRNVKGLCGIGMGDKITRMLLDTRALDSRLCLPRMAISIFFQGHGVSASTRNTPSM